MEHWREAVKEAEELVSAVKGNLTDDEKREVLADDLERRRADPLLYRAVVNPDAPAPSPTMLDAKEMYRKERMNGAEGRNQKNRLDRVCRRVEDALGPLNKLALIDLKREDGRALRDTMLATRKADGSLLSPASVRRELDVVRAIVSIGIIEFDLAGKASNPFDGLEVSKGNAAPENEWDRGFELRWLRGSRWF